MTEEALETIILGRIAKELKDDVQIGRQVTLAKTIIQALRIRDVVGRREELAAVKSLYEPNGLQLNKQGLEASKMFETAIERVYVYWLDRGYSPSEIREMLFSQVFTTSTFVNAMRS